LSKKQQKQKKKKIRAMGRESYSLAQRQSNPSANNQFLKKTTEFLDGTRHYGKAELFTGNRNKKSRPDDFDKK